MGSTNWGHQRKAVALVMTAPCVKSSARNENFFATRKLEIYPSPGQIMMISVPASVSSTFAMA